MAENTFTPITTQEALDAVIGARLARQKESLEEEVQTERDALQKTIREHEGTIGAMQKAQKAFEKQIADKDTELGALRGQVKGFERTALTERVAEAAGLSRAFAARLKGETEEELAADAKELAKLVTLGQEAPGGDPAASYGTGGGMDAAWGSMLNALAGSE